MIQNQDFLLLGSEFCFVLVDMDDLKNRVWQIVELQLELGEIQRKMGKVILRIGGLLPTWIPMLSLPWLQKQPSSGSHRREEIFYAHFYY